MSIEIQLDDAVARRLQARAESLGLSLSEYLRRIAEGHDASGAPATTISSDPAVDFDNALDELFAGDTPDLRDAVIPATTREEIYDDHD